MQTIKNGDHLRRQQKRKRLASPAVVISTGIAVLFLMIFLFPRSAWFHQVSSTSEKERGDSLKIVMLRDLMNNGQNSLSVCEDYAKQLELMGNYEQAFLFLDSLLKNKISDSLFTLRQLQAEVAKSSGRKVLAIKMYSELAKLDTLQAKDLYEQAATLAMQQDDYLMSSDLYFRAENSSRNFKDKKNEFLNAMHTLQAGNNLDRALTQGELQIQNLTSDSEVLVLMVKLARAAGQTKVAEKYVQILVKPQVSYRSEK